MLLNTVQYLRIRGYAINPKNKGTFVAPSCGLFQICRGEKYTALYPSPCHPLEPTQMCNIQISKTTTLARQASS